MESRLEPVGTYFYNRTMLSFQVDEQLLQARLSPPWVANSDEYGNLVVGFCEVWGLFDAERQAAPHPVYHYIPFNGMATNTETGEQANMRYLTLSDRPDDLASPLTVAATVQHDRRVSTRGRDVRVEEEFVFTDADGGVVQAHVAYVRPEPRLGRQGEMRVRYPGAEGQAFVYRNEPSLYELVDVVKGINRIEAIEYAITVDGVRGLFDGSESLMDVTVVPTDKREMFRE